MEEIPPFRDFNPEISTLTAALKNYRTAHLLSFLTSTFHPHLNLPRATLHEPLPDIHPAAGRHGAADGGDSARGHRCVLSTADLRLAASRLPDYSSADVLSRRKPRRHGHHRHCSFGAAIRRDARPQPDDLHECRWSFRG